MGFFKNRHREQPEPQPAKGNRQAKRRKTCTGRCKGNGDYFSRDVKPSGGYRTCSTCSGTGYIYE